MAENKQRKPVTVGFVSLGCPKNVVDSEKMLAQIAQAGLVITTDPDNADVVVINTCAFIPPARAEALEAIKHAVKCKAAGTVDKVIVAGCLPQRSGKELFSLVDGIDAIVGLDRRDDIARIIKETIHSDKSRTFVDHQPEMLSQPGRKRSKQRLKIHDDRARLLITPRHWAYLRISEGCSHRCSFCTIPAIRGPFRSKPQELILAEAAELVSAGVVELNIIAQDTTNYGRDLKIKDGLACLLGKLEQIPGLKWIRLMYLRPSGITDRLIKTIADSEKIVHYLDIPIQHINDKILKDMCRSDTGRQIRRLIENLRSAIADIVLRTTLIAGFPGESEQQFDELLDFVKWARFDALGCFRYYPERGTDAARMPRQVPDSVKQNRLHELMLTQQRIAFAANESRVGCRLLCLVDSLDKSQGGIAHGRFYGQAPDIDSLCIIKKPTARTGQFIDVKVVATHDYDLLVEQI